MSSSRPWNLRKLSCICLIKSVQQKSLRNYLVEDRCVGVLARRNLAHNVLLLALQLLLLVDIFILISIVIVIIAIVIVLVIIIFIFIFVVIIIFDKRVPGTPRPADLVAGEIIIKTRSLRPFRPWLLAWDSSGLLDFVLCSLQALRPCDPHNGAMIG